MEGIIIVLVYDKSLMSLNSGKWSRQLRKNAKCCVSFPNSRISLGKIALGSELCKR